MSPCLSKVGDFFIKRLTMNIKEQIIKAYKEHEAQYGNPPHEANVTVSFNIGDGVEKTVVWVGDGETNDGVYFHACRDIYELLGLCDNGNGQQFTITEFHGFNECRHITLWAFIAGKIREVHVNELKVHIMSSMADSTNGEVSVETLRFKAAGIDKEYVFRNTLQSASSLPKNIRFFKKPETLQEALEEGGEWLFGNFNGWEDEYIPELCPLVKLGDQAFYRSTDIDQDFYDHLPDNMFYEEDGHGIKTVCSWKWNGYKPVHVAVCEDSADLIYDVINRRFNLDHVSMDCKWYATADLCREDNKIEIVRF